MMRLSSTLLFTFLASVGHQLPTTLANDGIMNMTNATNGTEAPIEPNDCDMIEIGSVYFLFLNSVDPDEVAFFVFDDLPGNLPLYLTDNAWNGVEFQTDEGTLEMTTPADGIAAGTFFGFGPGVPRGTEWKTVDGSFSLSPEGEQIFLYCWSADGSERPLTAISYNGEFQPPGLETYGFNESALPTELLEKEGAIVLPTEEHWFYAGPSIAEADALKELLKDTNNWSGGDGRSDFSGATTALVSGKTLLILVGGAFWSVCLWVC